MSDPVRISKIVRDIIPSFNEKNMLFKMFVEHCRVSASMVSPQEVSYLTMLFKTKIIKMARVHIQDRVGITSEKILKTLEQIYSCQQDTSQLLQDLANVKRMINEYIPEYGAHFSQIINKLTNKIMETTPIEKAVGICEAYRITSVENFLHGSDKDVYSQIRDKEINTLEKAIALANQADLQ